METTSRSTSIGIGVLERSIASTAARWTASNFSVRGGILTLTPPSWSSGTSSLRYLIQSLPNRPRDSPVIRTEQSGRGLHASNPERQAEKDPSDDGPLRVREFLERQNTTQDAPTNSPSPDIEESSNVAAQGDGLTPRDARAPRTTNDTISVARTQTTNRTVFESTTTTTSRQFGVLVSTPVDTIDPTSDDGPGSSRVIDPPNRERDQPTLQWLADDPSPTDQYPVTQENETTPAPDLVTQSTNAETRPSNPKRDAPTPAIPTENPEAALEPSHTPPDESRTRSPQRQSRIRSTTGDDQFPTHSETNEPRLTLQTRTDIESTATPRSDSTSEGKATTATQQSASSTPPVPSNESIEQAPQNRDSDEQPETDPIKLLRSGGPRHNEFVDELYRALERKRSIERKRRGH